MEEPMIQNGNGLKKRSIISPIIALAKMNLFDVINRIIKEKTIKVSFENEKYLNSLLSSKSILSEISQKLSNVKVSNPEEKQELESIAILLDTILTIFNSSLGQTNKLLKSSSTSAIQQSTHIQALLTEAVQSIRDLDNAISRIKFESPILQKVEGKVGVTSLPKIYDFERIVKQLVSVQNSIQEVRNSIGNIKLEVPVKKEKEIRFPEFPKQFSLSESKEILAALSNLQQEIQNLPKNIPQVEFPNSISVDNFPPQKYPMPVTHVSINGLRGYVKSRSITVSDSVTPLPDEVLANRRSLVIYNNSSVTVFIGGSDVTTTNGMPVPASSYSPALDASSNLILYGIVSTGTANVRVLEASDEASGK